MDRIRHTEVTVNTDEKQAENFEGSLEDFACQKLNKLLKDEFKCCIVLNIESCMWQSEMRPVQSNSSTWYTRTSLRLSVWLSDGEA